MVLFRILYSAFSDDFVLRFIDLPVKQIDGLRVPNLFADEINCIAVTLGTRRSSYLFAYWHC